MTVFIQCVKEVKKRVKNLFLFMKKNHLAKKSKQQVGTDI